MKTLYLIRHAKSSWGEIGSKDIDVWFHLLRVEVDPIYKQFRDRLSDV